MLNGTEVNMDGLSPGIKRMSAVSDELVGVAMNFAKSLAKPSLSDNDKDEILLGFVSALSVVMISIVRDHEEREVRTKNLMKAMLTNLDKFKDHKDGHEPETKN